MFLIVVVVKGLALRASPSQSQRVTDSEKILNISFLKLTTKKELSSSYNGRGERIRTLEPHLLKANVLTNIKSQ